MILFVLIVGLIRGIQLSTRRRLSKQRTSTRSRSRTHGHAVPTVYLLSRASLLSTSDRVAKALSLDLTEHEMFRDTYLFLDVLASDFAVSMTLSSVKHASKAVGHVEVSLLLLEFIEQGFFGMQA